MGGEDAGNCGPLRWEFRCWPRAELANGIAARLDEATHWTRSPDERRTDSYFLIPHRPDLLPKLRGGERFEVKRRVEVRGGLERWQMALSTTLPLSDATQARADALIGVRPNRRGEVSSTNGCDEMTRADVLKDRRRWVRDRTTVEVTRTTLGWTVALEEPDHATLIATLAELGLSLDLLPNRHYGAALRR